MTNSSGRGGAQAAELLRRSTAALRHSIDMAGAYPGHGGSAHTPAAAPPAVPVATGGHVGGALSQAMLDELQLVWCQAAGLWSRRLSQRGCAWLVWIVTAAP